MKPDGARRRPGRDGVRADDPRSLAAASLARWRSEGRYINLEVASTLSRAALSGPDRALYTALVYGAAERALTLDHVLAPLSSRPLDELDGETRCALWIGLYQLFLEGYDIPVHEFKEFHLLTAFVEAFFGKV